MDPIRMLRAQSFDDDPELYDKARPTYPAEIFDALWRVSGLSATPLVLEVGCGTGQASCDLLRRGAQLTCVEMGAGMAALAIRNLSPLGNVRIVNSKFEDLQWGGPPFDLVFAAASWHWMDRTVKYEKAAGLLGPNGKLAIVASKHAFPSDYDPLFDAIQEIYRKETDSHLEWPPKGPESIPEDTDDLQAGGFFRDTHVESLLWHKDFSTQEYIDLLATHSDHRILEQGNRERLLDGIAQIIDGGPAKTLRRHYLTRLRVATKA